MSADQPTEDVLPPHARDEFPERAPSPAQAPLPRRIGGAYARGLLMGTADLVPGVSGGTMALITGIYERLVDAVREVTALPLSLLRFDGALLAERARRVEWSLLLPVLAGMLSAIVLGAGILPDLLERHPERMNGLFFGLILGSLPVPWRMIERHTWREVAIAIAAAALAFVLTGLPERAIEDPSMLAVFGAAAVAICAMVLPGVSGSFLLLAMGMYAVTLDAVHERQMAYIGVFMLGALVGIAFFSRLLAWLLHNHHVVTMAALVGLMVGALRAIWPWLDEDRSLLAPSGGASEIAVVAAFALAGVVAVQLVIRLGELRQQS